MVKHYIITQEFAYKSISVPIRLQNNNNQTNGADSEGLDTIHTTQILKSHTKPLNCSSKSNVVPGQDLCNDELTSKHHRSKLLSWPALRKTSERVFY